MADPGIDIISKKIGSLGVDEALGEEAGVNKKVKEEEQVGLT